MRFVVLHHEMPPDVPRSSHWDLMLDRGTALRTWAVPVPPEQAADTQIDPLPAHRRKYLTYEGPVAGNRGTVYRWDQGTYRLIDETADSLLIDFAGQRLRGRRKIWLDSDTQRWRLSVVSE